MTKFGRVLLMGGVVWGGLAFGMTGVMAEEAVDCKAKAKESVEACKEKYKDDDAALKGCITRSKAIYYHCEAKGAWDEKAPDLKDDAEAAKEKAGSWADRAKSRAEELKEGAKDKAHELGQGAREKAGELGQGAKDKAQDASEGARKLKEDAGSFWDGLMNDPKADSK